MTCSSACRLKLSAKGRIGGNRVRSLVAKQIVAGGDPTEVNLSFPKGRLPRGGGKVKIAAAVTDDGGHVAKTTRTVKISR